MEGARPCRRTARFSSELMSRLRPERRRLICIRDDGTPSRSLALADFAAEPVPGSPRSVRCSPSIQLSPVTGTAAPWMARAASEARNRITRARSTGATAGDVAKNRDWPEAPGDLVYRFTDTIFIKQIGLNGYPLVASGSAACSLSTTTVFAPRLRFPVRIPYSGWARRWNTVRLAARSIYLIHHRLEKGGVRSRITIMGRSRRKLEALPQSEAPARDDALSGPSRRYTTARVSLAACYEGPEYVTSRAPHIWASALGAGNTMQAVSADSYHHAK